MDEEEEEEDDDEGIEKSISPREREGELVIEM